MDGFDSLSQNIPLSTHKYLEDIKLKPHILGKSKPKFDPPYGSPLEEEFARNIVKYLDEAVIFQKQIPADTLCGNFKLGFIVQQAERSIGLECDGKEYHNLLRAQWRDAMILETELVTVIYRFRGKDLYSSIKDCLFVLSAWEPQLFSERGLTCLKTLASNEAKASCQRQLDEEDHFFCAYEEYRYEYGISIERHSYNPVNRDRNYLMEISAFAKQHGGGNLDHLMKKFDIEHNSVF